ncbi:MAG: serine protease [Thermoplasmatales archaeon B_DKE]|nr:MAG: serine protease [Thermoplasmatales archaeon B_DKE]
MKIGRVVLSMLILAFLVFLIVPLHSGAQPQVASKNLMIINLDEEIDPGSASMITQALSPTNTVNTAAVVISMNTPGGILNNMIQMVDAINATEERGIPVYTYIIPDGMGASAGSYVAMASTGIYMGPGSFIGPSTPIVVGGTALEQNHTEAAMFSLMQSMASAHGRNATAAGIMVTQNYAYNYTSAISVHLVDGGAANLTVFLKDAGLSSYPQTIVNPSVYDNFLSFLSNTYVDGILILVGVIAILLDLYHGTVLLSVAGVVMIALGLIGAEIVGASPVGLVFLLLGAVLIILEFKTGHGIALMAGVIVGIFGVFLLASPYLAANQYGYSPSPVNNSSIIAALIIVFLALVLALYIRKLVRSMKSRKFTGSEALIGSTGITKDTVGKDGTIAVDGVMWRAESVNGEEIPPGTEVTVIRRDGLKVYVERVKK